MHLFMTLHRTKSDNVKQTMYRIIIQSNDNAIEQYKTSPIMTKCTNEQEKIDAWMKRKDEHAQQLISSFPEGTNFTTAVEKSRQMQSSITNINKKMKNNQEVLPSECEFMNDNNKTIAKCCFNCNRCVRLLVRNNATLSETCQRGRIAEMSSMIESLFVDKLNFGGLQFNSGKHVKPHETVIIRERNLKLSTAPEIFDSMEEENQITNKALNFIKKDFIPFRNMLAHATDDNYWNATVSEFDFHCNQGLIGRKLLLDHINSNLDYCNGDFHYHVHRSIRLNQEMFHYFD